MRRSLPPLLVLALFLLHDDSWLWSDRRLVMGLPAGMIYHLAYCLAATAVMALLVLRFWPQHLEVEPEPAEPREPGGSR